MAVTNKFTPEQYALCSKPWTGNVCPHGVDHTDNRQNHIQVCSVCLEYSITGGEG